MLKPWEGFRINYFPGNLSDGAPYEIRSASECPVYETEIEITVQRGENPKWPDLFNSVIVGGTAWSGNISYIIFPLSTYLSIRQLAFPTVYCVPLLLLLLPDHCRAIIYVKLFLYLQSSSSLAGGFFSEMRFFLCSTNCHITSANKRCGSGGGGVGVGGGSCWRGAGVTGWAWVLLLLLAAEIGCGLWHRWKSCRNPRTARKALMPEYFYGYVYFVAGGGTFSSG